MDINKHLNTGIQSGYVFFLLYVGVGLANKPITRGSVNLNTTDVLSSRHSMTVINIHNLCMLN